jgi:phenylalanyl-tRNA synthetase alpha chain
MTTPSSTPPLDDQLEALLAAALQQVSDANTLPIIEEVRITYLGKTGLVTQALAGLRHLEGDAKKAAGAAINQVKEAVVSALTEKKAGLEAAALALQLQAEAIDVTLPARPEQRGRVHPLMQAAEEALAIFASMGFSVADGPDIEDEFHNFTALNMPETHPARQMHDTFYLPADVAGVKKLLRTHTSSVQIRTMKAGKPPFRIVSFGRTYRSDWDMTHTPMFHQIEGLWIDTDTSMAHLKGCLQEFLSRFFATSALPMRLRPSFFPFTEPSAEVDVRCSRKGGSLTIGQGDDWLEVLGCGMVHPSVLEHVGIDPTQYRGFAFGMGVERLAMLKYGIPDLRTFFEGDARWLAHQGFAPTAAPALPDRI